MADITGTTPDTRVPTVVVDDVHITYTVNGARTGRGSATSALNRIVSRGQPRAPARCTPSKASASPRTRARPSA